MFVTLQVWCMTNDRAMVQVIAVDKDDPSFCSTAEVTINIEDDNDNSPEFPKDTYKLEVPEHSPVGTEVATITVSPYDLNSHTAPAFILWFQKLSRCFFFSFRQMIQTQWIKATWHTNFFLKACTCHLFHVAVILCFYCSCRLCLAHSTTPTVCVPLFQITLLWCGVTYGEGLCEKLNSPRSWDQSSVYGNSAGQRHR